MARMDVRGAFAMGVSSNGRTLATLHAGVPGQGTHGGAMVQVWDMESIPAKIMNTLPLADLVPKSHASCLSHVSYQATMVVKGEDMGIVGATWQHMVCTFPLKAGMERGRIITDCKYPVHVATDGVQVTVCNWSKPWFQVFNADLEVVFAGRVRGTSKPMHVRFVDKARALVLGRDRQIHLMCTRTWTVVWSRPMSIAMPECTGPLQGLVGLGQQVLPRRDLGWGRTQATCRSTRHDLPGGCGRGKGCGRVGAQRGRHPGAANAPGESQSEWCVELCSGGLDVGGGPAGLGSDPRQQVVSRHGSGRSLRRPHPGQTSSLGVLGPEPRTPNPISLSLLSLLFVVVL